MLSNAFNLFNFFQQPNTGKIPAPETYRFEELETQNLISGISGRVADFNWRFPYIDRVTPRQIFDTRGNYEISIRSEADVLESYGIRTPIFSNKLSGSFYKDTNNSFLKFNINGKIFPHNKDFSNLNPKISGFFKKSPREFSSIKNSISGSVTNFNFYFNNISNKISGLLEDAKTDFGFLKNEISGIINSGILDKNEINLEISGIFFPLLKDSANIEYYVSEYISDSTFRTGIKIEDSVNLSYYISSYTSAS